MESYRELIVWQKSIDLVTEIYSITSTFPGSERFNLMSQMRRAAVSIPSNIAEGSARRHTKEYMQFIRIAFGSGAELETQLLIAKRLRFLSENDYNTMSASLTEIMKMLNKLLSSLMTKL